jgi:hypothetical protein
MPIACQPTQCGLISDGCGGSVDCGTTGGLPPACNGVANGDCDDWPEDCDELCCPCKPQGACGNPCPNSNEVRCLNGGFDPNGTCVDASSDPNHCGACDGVCSTGQTCVSGVCQ